jgi:hypothetical protein
MSAINRCHHEEPFRATRDLLFSGSGAEFHADKQQILHWLKPVQDDNSKPTSDCRPEGLLHPNHGLAAAPSNTPTRVSATI